MSDFPSEMEQHLISFKEETQYIPPTNPRKRWEHIDVTDNLFPPIRHGFIQHAYDQAIDFHDYARHVRSSQIFCFNLFYPLVKSGEIRHAFFEKLGLEYQAIDSWSFEYQLDDNYLGEWRGSKKPIKYITSVDFAAVLTTATGSRVAVLTEVKFTEDDFSKCGGLTSNGNKNKQFCKHEFKMENIASDCYMVEKGRKYFDLTKGSHIVGNSSSCPFGSNNQCLRNHAMAKSLVENGIVDKAYFGLAYHDGNKKVLDEWRSYLELCNPSESGRLFEINAGTIVGLATDPTYKRYFKDRYLIK